MASPRRAGVVLLLVAGLLAGCAGLRAPSASLEERRAFVRAQKAEEQGEPARELYESFLARYPESPLAADAELALGDLDRQAGDVDAARARYRRAVDARGAAGDRARVRLAALALEAGDTAAARDWLGPTRLSRLEGADLRNAYRLLAESAADPAERLRWLAALRAELPDPDELAALDGEIDSELARLPRDVLADAARRVGDRPPAARIYLSLAERELAEGDADAARDALKKARTRALAPRYAGRLAELEARLGAPRRELPPQSKVPSFAELRGLPYPEIRGAEGTLGVLLPLSGPFAHYGEHALHGVQLAAGSFEADRGLRIRVVVRDSAGDPARAAAGVRELAAEGVVAIVGPMLSAASEAAAEEAEAQGVPLLALSARDSVARGREWAFRLRTSPAEEAQLVAERAIALGDRRFAILYPAHPAGRGFRALFWDAVEARGGEVVAVASYDPEATDFSDSIRRLVGYTLLGNEEKALLREREGMLERARRLPARDARALRAKARSLTRRDGRPIPPIVDFDALYIPDSHDNVVLIAPQLAFHEVNGPRLLGTDGWTDPDLVRLASRHVEGALFSSYFYADSELPHVRDFGARFEQVFGEVPGSFAAQSYDATRLVLVQLANGHSGRRDVRHGLLETRAYPGVSGVVSMDGDGSAHKRPFLLGVEDGKLTEYDD